MILVGYLIPLNNGGWTVRCPQCEADEQGPNWMHKLGNTVRIFHENIYPYSQACGICHRIIVHGRKGWPELFNGKPHHKQ